LRCGVHCGIFHSEKPVDFSELVGLRVEDLLVAASGRGATILIRRAKNDPFGSGRLGYVPENTCKLLDDWFHATIVDGWIFRRVRGQNVGYDALNPYSVYRIIKSTAEAAELPQKIIDERSGHPMRVGAAQGMISAGLSVLPIMQAGGWKSMNVLARYIEKANLEMLMDRARH
jgi:Phage integrase family